MMYGAAPAPQTQKKSRAGLVVGIIIAAVLVLGVAVAIGGYFIYQNVVANVPDPTIPKITDPGTKPDTNPDTNPGPSTVTPPTPNNPPASKPLVDDFKNPYVVLDEAEIKITIDVGSGTTENAGGYYDVYCVVENKTDREFSIYLEEVSGDGYLGDSGNVYIFPDFYDYSSLWDFAPGECLSIFSFQTDEVDGKVTKFKAKLVVFDANSYEDVCEYYIEIPEL